MDIFQYSVQAEKEILSRLNVDPEKGVDSSDLEKRTARYGVNRLEMKKFSAWRIFWRQFKSAFVYLLAGAIVVTLFLGEYTDALMIFIFLAFNTILGFFQEYRSEKTIELLKEYTAPRARVRRDGRIVTVNAETLVVGDIVSLEIGDKVPADLRIIMSDGLAVDESVLTGESVPIYKDIDVLAQAPSSYHQALNLAFSGTNIIKGHGEGVVVAVGRDTAFGSIAKLASESRKVSDFEKGISGFSRFILKLIGLTLVLVMIAHVIISHGTTDILNLIVFSVALTISVIPEALPLVMTCSLAQGARVLAKNKVVVKRLSAIEDLGGIEVLCSDKTGTLTENKLEIADVSAPDRQAAIFLANLASAFDEETRTEPFDIALEKGLSADQVKALAACKKLDEAPFDPHVKYNAALAGTASGRLLVVRGALESVMPLCPSLSSSDKDKISAWAAAEGRQGHRTLAVASCPAGDGPEIPKDIDKQALVFGGVISFLDPIKDSTPEAVKQAGVLGVKLVIITGDSPEVAGAVAKQIGLTDSEDFVITGDDWLAKDEKERRSLLETYRVFARVSPEQKFEIINTFRENHLVGFLGEGINDAPALKVAGVSLVVDSASDIAREEADIILLQHNLAVIIDGVREGRRVFANSAKYIRATLASNFGNFFAVAFASLLVNYLPMLPIQILLLNLLTDTPMISIATDNVDPEELKSPKKYEVNEIISIAIILGLVSTVFDFLVFAIFFHAPQDVLRTNWFIASALTELIFVFSIRTRFFFLKSVRPSWPILSLTAAIYALTLILPYSAFGQRIFQFVPPTGKDIVLVLTLVAVYFMVSEAAKLMYYRWHKRQTA